MSRIIAVMAAVASLFALTAACTSKPKSAPERFVTVVAKTTVHNGVRGNWLELSESLDGTGHKVLIWSLVPARTYAGCRVGDDYQVCAK